jgi:hypothetical protein
LEEEICSEEEDRLVLEEEEAMVFDGRRLFYILNSR